MPLSPRVSVYDGLLLDLDGCLWVGDDAVDGAPEALAAWRAAGKRVTFLTNDPGSPPDYYVRKLWRLGFQASASEVITVGTATEHLLAKRGSGTAFVIGSQALVDHVALAGLKIVNRTDQAERADVVVVAGHHGFNYEELKVALRSLHRGAQLIGAGRDATYPRADGLWPGSGAVLAAVETAAGRTADVEIGKPQAPMYDAAAAELGPGRHLAVGDRLDSDIAGARAAGLDSALVLTGVTGERDARAADPGPTLITPNIATLVLG